MRKKENDISVKVIMMLWMCLLFGVAILFPQRVVNASSNADQYYDYDTYAVQYIVDGIWNDGYNVRVIVTNKTDQPINDWEIVFSSKDEIVNIWNANVAYNEENTYIISDNIWNKDVPANGCIEWGYTASYKNEPSFIDNLEVREEITENISNNHFESIIDLIEGDKLENGEEIILDNAYIIEYVEDEEQDSPMLRAGAYSSTKTSRATYHVKVLSTKKKVFSIQQTVKYIVNSVKNTVKITSHQVTVKSYANGYSGEVKYTSRLNVENKIAAASFATVTIKHPKGKYPIITSVTVYPTGGYRFSYQ